MIRLSTGIRIKIAILTSTPANISFITIAVKLTTINTKKKKKGIAAFWVGVQ